MLNGSLKSTLAKAATVGAKHAIASTSLLAALSLSGCESPFAHKNEVDEDFRPGISMDLSRSTLTVEKDTVVAGKAVEVILTLRDQNGEIFVPTNPTINISFTGGTSTGFFKSFTRKVDGSYSAMLTGVRAGTPSTVGCTVNGETVNSTNPRVRVIAGDPVLTKSQLSVSNSKVASGSTISIHYRVTDSMGNQLPVTGLNVAFSLAGGSSVGSLGNVTDNQDGSYTALYTGSIAGSPNTVSVSVNSAPVSISGPPTVQVVSGQTVAAKSVLSVSLPEIASGRVSVITLIAKDAIGNQNETGGRTVTFSYAGGTSTGTISGTRDNGDGTYSADFTGVLAGSATTIHASINGDDVTSTLPTVTVLAGSLAVNSSVLTVSAPVVASGSDVTISLVLKDAAGNTLGPTTDAIFFSHNGGTSTGTIGQISYQGEGTYTAPFTGVHAGTATTISAVLGGVAKTSGLPTVTVVPGPLSLLTSLITVESPTVAVGANDKITFTARDAAGNQLLAGGLTVGFSYSNGTSVGLIGPVQDGNNGTYTADFLGQTVGTPVSISGTVGSNPANPILSASPTIKVDPAPISLALSTVAVSAPTVVSGNQVTATLVIRDTNNAIVNKSDLVVLFTQGGGSSTGDFSEASYQPNGSYTATFTGKVAGTPTFIGAKINGSPVTSTLPTETVTPGPFSLTNSTISSPTPTVASGDTVPLTFTAKDANGNTVPNNSLSVSFDNNGGTSDGTFSAATYAGNGNYTSNFTATQAGSTTYIIVIVNGVSYPIGQGMPITVSAGVPSMVNSVLTASPTSIASGSNSVLTLVAKDSNGNVLSSGGLTVAFSYSGGTSTGTIGPTTNHGNGSYTANFTGVLAGTATTISATINGSAIQSAKPSVTVTPGALSLSGSTLTLSSPTVVSGSTVNCTLTLRDAAGNALGAAGSGRTVVPTFTAGGSTVEFGAVSGSNGVYTCVITGKVAGGPTTIGATVNGQPLTGVLPQLTVTPSSAFSLAHSTVTASPTTIASGTQGTLTLILKDSNGNPVSSSGQNVVFSQSLGLLGIIGPVVDNGNGTYTATYDAKFVGGPSVISVKVNGSFVTSAMPSITVVPGVLSVAQSTIEVDTSAPNVGQTITFTVTARDLNGNPLSPGGAVVVISMTGTMTATPGTLIDNHNGTYTQTFTVTGAGSGTFSATISGTNITQTVAVQTSSGPTFQVPIEMIDIALGSQQTQRTYEVSRTPIDTNDYDGSPTYAFEITATNSQTTSRGVSLVDGTGAVKATISVPAEVSSRTRYVASFTPTSGASSYRVRMDATLGAKKVVVYTARILINQNGASKTKLYIPLVSGDYGDYSFKKSRWVDSTTSDSYTQFYSERYSYWKKDVANLATIPSGNAWQFDAVLWNNNDHYSTCNGTDWDSDYHCNHDWDSSWDDDNDGDDRCDHSNQNHFDGNSCSAALFSTTSNAQVAGSVVTTHNQEPGLYSASFSNSAANFNNLDTFQVKLRGDHQGKCYLGKAGLWVKLSPLSKGEIFYRLEKSFSRASGQLITSSGRAQIDMSKFNSLNTSVFFEATASKYNSSSSFILRSLNHGSADSGISGGTAVTGCSISSSSLSGTIKGRVRSSACTMSGSSRYIHELNTSSGKANTAGSFMVIQFR